MAKIGFIGLGHMGNPMVQHLMAAGHTVKVFDISKEAMQALTENGAQPCSSLAELAKDSDAIFTMVQTGEQIKCCCLGDEGIFAHAASGTLYLDTSSIDVDTSREIHKIAREKGFPMVDAPVSGGVAGADAATLTIMVGGTEANFEEARPYLELLGKKIVHAGPEGNGQAAKICNNMILGISMIGVCEAFTLGEKLGLDPKTFFEISSQASGQCWAMTSYCPVPGVMDNVPANNDYQPGFTAQMMLKDLSLSQAAAESVDVSTPLGENATALYALFNERGFAGMDFSGIIKMIAGD